MSVTLAPTTTLQSGAKGEFPVFGFGTYGGTDSADTLAQAIESAIDAGYRHFDLAEVYGNQKELGATFKRLFDSGKITREELFITTKVWNSNHKPEDVMKSVDNSLKDLQMDYADLVLVHWPLAFKHLENTEGLSQNDIFFPRDSAGNMLYESGVSLVDTWRAMESVCESGKARHIGVSNYNVALLIDLLSYAKIKPAVLQIENHASLPQFELVNMAQRNGIAVTAYTPLGRPEKAHKTSRILLQEKTLVSLAEKYGVQPANIVLAWLVSRKIVPVPKSKTPSRIAANFKDSLKLKLSQEDIEKINNINGGDPVRYTQVNTKTFTTVTGGSTLFEDLVAHY